MSAPGKTKTVRVAPTTQVWHSRLVARLMSYQLLRTTLSSASTYYESAKHSKSRLVQLGAYSAERLADIVVPVESAVQQKVSERFPVVLTKLDDLGCKALDVVEHVGRTAAKRSNDVLSNKYISAIRDNTAGLFYASKNAAKKSSSIRTLPIRIYVTFLMFLQSILHRFFPLPVENKNGNSSTNARPLPIPPRANYDYEHARQLTHSLINQLGAASQYQLGQINDRNKAVHFVNSVARSTLARFNNARSNIYDKITPDTSFICVEYVAARMPSEMNRKVIEVVPLIAGKFKGSLQATATIRIIPARVALFLNQFIDSLSAYEERAGIWARQQAIKRQQANNAQANSKTNGNRVESYASAASNKAPMEHTATKANGNKKERTTPKKGHGNAKKLTSENEAKSNLIKVQGRTH